MRSMCAAREGPIGKEVARDIMPDAAMALCVPRGMDVRPLRIHAL
jgi:hypothetical protein